VKESGFMIEKTTETPEVQATPNEELAGEHPSIIRFRGCKHLDYGDNFTNCTKENFSGILVAWMRHDIRNLEAPKVVQFCKLRGRLNQLAACIGKCNAQCALYDEVEHAIEYEK